MATETDIVPESLTPQEAFNLPNVSTTSTVTLSTLDLSQRLTAEQANTIALSGIGWDPIDDVDVPAFLQRYQAATGMELIDVISNPPDGITLARGGTSDTTCRHLGLLTDSVTKVISHVPLGRSNGAAQPLIDVVNDAHASLSRSDAKLELRPTWHDGRLSPVILAFLVDGTDERQMVLLKGCKDEGINPDEVFSYPDSLQVIDSYEMSTPDSPYAAAAKKMLTTNPDTVTVIGLGSTRVIEGATPHILEMAETAKHLGISGNKGEMQLLRDQLGVDETTQIIEKTGARFVLETNGKEGATLHIAHLGEIHSCHYTVPSHEIYTGNNTNAGDVFLAATISGLLKFDATDGLDADALQGILSTASTYTYEFLQNRNT